MFETLQAGLKKFSTKRQAENVLWHARLSRWWDNAAKGEDLVNYYSLDQGIVTNLIEGLLSSLDAGNREHTLSYLKTLVEYVAPDADFSSRGKDKHLDRRRDSRDSDGSDDSDDNRYIRQGMIRTVLHNVATNRYGEENVSWANVSWAYDEGDYVELPLRQHFALRTLFESMVTVGPNGMADSPLRELAPEVRYWLVAAKYLIG